MKAPDVRRKPGKSKRKTMGKETTNAGRTGDLQRFKGALDAHAEAHASEIPYVEAPRAKLSALLDQVTEIQKEQAQLTAARQQASQDLRKLLTEGERLATVIRLALKEHYGIRSEKVAAFGIQPFRGKPRSAKPAPEETAAAAAPPAKTRRSSGARAR